MDPSNITLASNSTPTIVAITDSIFYDSYFSKFVSIYTATLLACLITHRIGKCPNSLKIVTFVILLDLTLFLALPVLLTAYVLVLIVRQILTHYFTGYCENKFELLDPCDVAWAGETHAQCNNFTSLYVLQGQCNLDDIRRRIQTQLVEKIVDGKRIYKRLEYRVVRKFGFYCWERYDDFKVEKHVRRISGTKKEFSEDELFGAMSSIADVPIASDKPQWEILVVPKFIYNGSSMQGQNFYAVIFRVHHSIMDGVSAGHALKYALADEPVKFSVDPLKAPSISSAIKLLLYVKALILGPMLLLNAMNVREVNGFHNKVVTGPKTFGWSKPVNMDALKKIKIQTETTTTAVLMSAIGGAMRNLAIKKNIPVPRRIHAAPTVAMLPYPDTAPRNRFIVIHYMLDTGLSSRLERIKAAHKEALRLSTSVEPVVIFEIMKIGGRLPAALADALMGTLRATIILSNVPGPVESAKLFGGHSLVDSVFWVPLRNWTGTRIITKNTTHS